MVIIALGEGHEVPLLEDDDDPVPARLRELMEAYAADGLPPAYLPMDESEEDQ